MNLKRSKFLTKIQYLRKLSKDKVRRQNASRFAVDLKDVLQEKHAILQISDLDQCRITSTHKIDPDKDVVEEETPININGNGLIQLNNICFHLKCTPQKPPYREEGPTISSIKASICVSNSRYHVVSRAAKQIGYKVVKEDKLWNVIWMDSVPGVEVYKSMKRFQQINHFPGMIEICRKDLLSRNLNRMLKLFPTDYKIFPKSWIFPADYGEAMSFALSHKPRTFIIKPDCGAQGRGIWLTNDLKNVNPIERMICQTYISRPLLIDGYKFDLRIYTLITSVDPLRIFVYNEGLARFATNKYVEPCADNSTDLFMHLTNYSVNRRSTQYELCDDDDCGSKRNFSAINSWLMRNNHSVDQFWDNIDDIIIKTVLTAWPMLKHNYHACFPSHDKIQGCFEILGFDVLVDSKLKPFILEVNSSPSFHTHEEVDKQVKRALIRDTLTLIGTVLADKKKIIREDRKRVKQRLLKKKHENETTRGASNLVVKKPETTGCPLSMLAQQIAWEESHLGNFRRIMPPQDTERVNYYCKFYALENQSSIYAETMASKKREEDAKKLRLKLEEKRQKELDNLNHIERMRTKREDRRRKTGMLSRTIKERQRLNRFKIEAQWKPGFISDAEERLRDTWMGMRTEMLRNMKIVPYVYCVLYKSGNLTRTDITNYPELYRSLENGVDVLADPHFMLD